MSLPYPPYKEWYPNFSQWNAAAVRHTLGFEARDQLPGFQDWLAGSDAALDNGLAGYLENLRTQLKRLQYAWNETELLAGFVAPLLATVSFGDEHYGLFHQRELMLEFDGKTTKGTVDGLVALGNYEPKVPFFFIHEYKRSQGFEADPEGQLLIAMVAAQHLNNDGLPIYGCYIIGKSWNFVLLDGKQYAVSQGYDATDPAELRIIWRILHHTKLIIEERVATILAAFQNQ